METPAASAVTSLLSNADLDRLARLRLRPLQRLTSRTRGEHLGGKGGTSTEFCDYRDYAAGDDLRHVDWNAFSRLHRPYLKVFHTEEERHVLLVLDASSSMRFEGKLSRAKSLAAAFAALALRGHERLSAFAFYASENSSRQMARLPSCAGRMSLRKAFAFIEAIDETRGGDLTLELGIERALQQHSGGRGIAIVISDFLTAGDLGRAFNLVAGAGLELWALQLLGPSERDPALAIQGDLRLVDSETVQALDLSAAGDLLALYHEYRLAHEQRLQAICQARAGRFVSLGSDEPLNTVLFDRLRRLGWIV
ncbi:MAG: DUF58 domain-containing protein [Verrucomicrobia bacterium]|nr:DUF58 domain-containing protein [Verrucomicrobiota bacterium]MBV9659080.1 DUF58 domain-containing protein [Verrucomicrobiota bacterium]